MAKSDIISAAIRYNACNNHLLALEKQISKIFSPNWARHVKMCSKLDKKQDGVQQSLVVFFSPPTHDLSVVLALAPIALALLIGPAFKLPPSTHILVPLAHILPHLALLIEVTFNLLPKILIMG